MIVEKRTYQLKIGAMHDFLKVYESEGLPLQSEVWGNLLGYFVSEVGGLNRVVQLWGFESFEDRLQRRAKLSAMPEWRAFLAKAAPMVSAQENELLTPAPFSPIK
jgi:hypothetical protein